MQTGAAGFLQVGEQPVEVVGGQVAEDRLQRLVGAAPERGDDSRHDTDGVAPFRGAQVQDGDRLRGVRQRQGRNGMVNPLLAFRFFSETGKNVETVASDG